MFRAQLGAGGFTDRRNSGFDRFWSCEKNGENSHRWSDFRPTPGSWFHVANPEVDTFHAPNSGMDTPEIVQVQKILAAAEPRVPRPDENLGFWRKLKAYPLVN